MGMDKVIGARGTICLKVLFIRRCYVLAGFWEAESLIMEDMRCVLSHDDESRQLPAP